ncbi:unnamed protein product [Rhizoctonia solani]|uniref:Peptidase C14 caspase domain-containing protein n=1 Tax=Rhizoctonia solani TaxID=456999 RepID=A0A8H2WDQ2_9AGAM|nr:unnamed protein product [Rhizoctonia solani]
MSTNSLYILAVAPDYLNKPENYRLKGPGVDVRYLENLFYRLGWVRFTSLYGESVTTENVLHGTKEVLSKCTKGDVFCIYLAGHGESSSTGYEFVTQSGPFLNHRLLLDTISDYCPQGVYVLQIRDTCASSPRPEEIREILSIRPRLYMSVLAACDVGEQAWERGHILPRSDFLRNMVDAMNHLPEEADKCSTLKSFWRRQVVTDMLDQVLHPMGSGDRRQTPRLEPREDKVEV